VSALFRPARAEDLPAIVALLAEDVLGATREAPGPTLDPAYSAAFEAIAADPNQLLAVAELAGEVVGTLQLSFIPGLARRGALRGQIEAVRVAARHRGAGLGEAMLGWAIAACRARGCALVQLTSDKARSDAHRFYERLGFRATHEGYKLAL
jgi:GNAT superfamily N-acetyltransferase